MDLQPRGQPLSILRILAWIAAGLLCLSLLTYAADWTVWHLRGTPTQQIEVTRVSVATLKANKEEYYFEGTDTFACTQSLFAEPRAGQWTQPCWWLARHRQQVHHY